MIRKGGGQIDPHPVDLLQRQRCSDVDAAEAEQVNDYNGNYRADDRADNRNPSVTPVGATLALDREYCVSNARSEVTGWVEHNPIEIWDSVRTVVADALVAAGINKDDLISVGITNQRETAVVWDKNTGEPVYNAIVWQDTRTAPIVRELAGDEGVDRPRQRADQR